MSVDLLVNKLYPLLRGAVAYSLHLLEIGEDGRLHFPSLMSPEFGEGPDCTYELSLLKWGLETPLEIAEKHVHGEPESKRWRQTLDRLAPLSIGQQGFMVGANTPFDRAHHHFSHLIQVYPLLTVNVDQVRQCDLIKRSIDHFYSTNQSEFERTGEWDVLTGYTYTLLVSLPAVLEAGKRALDYPESFVNYRLVRPNSLYGEMGLCLETPLKVSMICLFRARKVRFDFSLQCPTHGQMQFFIISPQRMDLM